MKTPQSLRTPYYQEISEQIAQGIQQGNLLPHQRLPSTRELCTQFKVSKITVEKALKTLREQNLIYRIPGKGSFVAEPVSPLSDLKHFKVKGHIAFICPTLTSHHVADILSEVEQAAAQQGFRTLLCLSKGSFEKQEQIIQSLIQEEVDGMIIYPSEGEYYDEAILRMTVSKFPFVLVDKRFEKIKTSYVVSDHTKGAYLGTKELLQKGHRKIAFISTYVPEETSTIRDRLKGYQQAMEEAGIKNLQDLIFAGFFSSPHSDHPLPYDWEARRLVIENIKTFLKERPEITAILTMSPGNCSYIAKALQELDSKRAMQTEFAIFDVDEQLDYSKSPLLIISQKSREMGRLAVEILIKLMKKPTDIQTIVLPMDVRYI